MRDMGGIVSITILIALIGCVSSPYLEDVERTRHESDYLRTREELRDFRERIAVQSNIAIDDGSLDHIADTPDQLADPMMDEDMRIVVEARNAIEERNAHEMLSQTEWIADLRTEVRLATKASAVIEPTDRTAFRHPETVREDAWCAWYVKGGKRRELTIDPITREISQSLDWR